MQRIVVGTAVLSALMFLMVFAARRKRSGATGLPVAAKPLLSRAEQALYSRLVQTRCFGAGRSFPVSPSYPNGRERDQAICLKSLSPACRGFRDMRIGFHGDSGHRTR